jgi:hypothetical protein
MCGDCGTRGDTKQVGVKDVLIKQHQVISSEW